MTDRQTEPGKLAETYDKAKTKLADMLDRGKAKANAVSGGTLLTGDDRKEVDEAEHAWKDKRTEEVSDADKVRSQEEMKETFGEDDDKKASGDKTAVYEEAVPKSARGGDTSDKTADKVEIASPRQRDDANLASENPDAPARADLDKAALARMGRADDGVEPTDGLGIEGGPSVGHASDIGR